MGKWDKEVDKPKPNHRLLVFTNIHRKVNCTPAPDLFRGIEWKIRGFMSFNSHCVTRNVQRFPFTVKQI